jgi:4-hydroxy-2-oxoheptanedioate aldolase
VRHGVHVPWVNSAAEAERAVRAVKYSPRGTRGLAGSRASEWGLREPIEAYVERANRETLVVIQVETQEAVDAIDDYLKVDGVDVLFLGPTDLSQSLGHPGDLRHPTCCGRWIASPMRSSVRAGPSASTLVRST